jgi:FkbM family methyltransferase
MRVKRYIARKIYQVLFGDCEIAKINRFIDLAKHGDDLVEISAKLKVGASLFEFNAERISYSQVKMLFNEIDVFDNYCLQHVPGSNLTIVDIGAHIGVFPFVANRKIKSSTIYVVEPDQANLSLATKNMSDSTVKSSNSVKFFNFAISTERSKSKFYQSSKVDWRSTLLKSEAFLNHPGIDPGEFHSSYDVECVTLTDLLESIPEKKIDILKMTIAGEIEHQVLEIAFDAIRSRDIEFFALLVYPNNRDKVKSIFEDLGFTLWSTPRNNALHVYRRSRG